MRCDFWWYFLDFFQLLLQLLPCLLFFFKFLVQWKYIRFIAELWKACLRDRCELLAHNTHKWVLRGSADGIFRFFFVTWLLNSLLGNGDRRLLGIVSRADIISGCLFIINSVILSLLVINLLNFDLDDFIHDFLQILLIKLINYIKYLLFACLSREDKWSGLSTTIQIARLWPWVMTQSFNLSTWLNRLLL